MISGDDDRRAQIADFGIARIVGVVGFTTLTNRNFRFVAPELMPIYPSSQPIRPTFKSDIYSLALLFLQVSMNLLQTITDSFPFDKLFHGPDSSTRGLPYNHIPNDAALVKEIHRGGRPRRERYNSISDHHWALMEWCWSCHPDARPSITEVRHALSGLAEQAS